MPAERVAMRQARENFRLKFSAHVPVLEVARGALAARPRP
jgi:hypothetical protein